MCGIVRWISLEGIIDGMLCFLSKLGTRIYMADTFL